MKNLIYVRYENGLLHPFSVEEEAIKKNDLVVVSTNRGNQLGEAVSEIKEYSEEDVPDDLFSVVRLATEEDKVQFEKNREDAQKALAKAKSLVNSLSLEMKLVDCFYTLERNQLLFTFVSDNRVDFRELAKKLAQIYKTRIELRQIGVRDKAKEIGGLGPCGRFLCCNSFLTDFDSVSINMAKNQYIALNPTKINGVCGRLLCCLKYEDDQYTEMKKSAPKIGQLVEMNGVKGKVSSINLLTNTVVLELPNHTFVNCDLRDGYGSIK